MLCTEPKRAEIAAQLKLQNLPDPDFNSMSVEARPIVREKTALEIGFMPKHLVTKCSQILNPNTEAQARCSMPAQHQLVLLIRGMGQNKTHRPTPLLMNLCLCNAHKKELKVEDFQDLKTRSLLTGQLANMGMVMPNFKTLEMDFMPMKNGQPVEISEFQRRYPGPNDVQPPNRRFR